METPNPIFSSFHLAYARHPVSRPFNGNATALQDETCRSENGTSIDRAANSKDVDSDEPLRPLLRSLLLRRHEGHQGRHQ